MEAAAKREKEKQVIQEMISLYCRNVKRFAGMHISA